MPILLRLFVSLLPAAVLAAEPQPFDLHYAASYGNFVAAAERTLQADAAGGWYMHSLVSVQLLGRVVSSIDENSHFIWQDDLPLARDYQFEQKGIGSRSRSLGFATDGTSATYNINDDSGSIALAGRTFDVLNSGLVLRARVAAGEIDVNFNVADRSEVKSYHYHVVGNETVILPAGSFATVHVERVRDVDSDRTTDLWLAREHDFVLVKLLQSEPDGDTITLELKEGLVGGVAINPAADRTPAVAP